MIKNYFKIAIRSLIRNKFFTAINVLGLVLGISFTTMLYTYVRHELSYDAYYRQSDRTAVFLLIIAAINYINLTTSKASSRAREIGIRKVAGAVKGQLVFQFLTEAFLVTLVSMFLALVMMDLAFPYFNSITGKNFNLTLSTLVERSEERREG